MALWRILSRLVLYRTRTMPVSFGSPAKPTVFQHNAGRGPNLELLSGNGNSSVNRIRKGYRRSESSRTSTVQSVSDAGVPGVAILGIDAAEAFAKLFQIVCDRQVRDEFFILVADLPREPHAKRSTVGHRKVAAIHAVTEKCLRMQSIGHIDAVPRFAFHRDIHDVSGLWLDPDKVQDVGERHANPLGDVGPALFTREFGDVAARRAV